MANQGSQEMGEEVVVEAVNGSVDPRTETSTEQVATSTVAGSSVAGGEHMFIETEVYTTTVDYVGSTELVRTDAEPNSKQEQQQSEVIEQETIELDSGDHSLVVLDMAVGNEQPVVEGEPVEEQASQSVVVLSSYEDWLPEEKMYIVELAKTQNLDAICQLFGLSTEVVCSWIQESEVTNEVMATPTVSAYSEEHDVVLRDWVLSEQAQYKFISTKMLQEQASLLIQPQYPEFIPSMAWLHQFLVQNGLSLQLSIPSGSYSEVIAEISNRDTVGGEEVESSELMDDQTKRKRVYPSAMAKARKKIRLSETDPDVDGEYKSGVRGKGARGPYSTNRSVQFKKLAVELAKEKGLRPAARDLSISDSSLAYWMKIDLDSPREDRRRNNPNSGRPVKYGKELDMKLRNWVLKQYAKKQRLTISMICKKAQELITPECPDFMASRGWAQKFLKRYKLNVLNSKKAPTPEQLQEFATRLEASGMDLEAASAEASTSEQTEQQVLYQNSAQLISLFLENMKEQQQQQQGANHTADATEVETLSQEQQQQQQQLSQIVASTFHTEPVPTTSTYEQPVTEDSYSQEVGEYEGEQNEAEYYEEFETSVVQPEEQVQVEIVGVELDESGNPKDSINIPADDGEQKTVKSPVVTLSTLPEGFDTNQVPLSTDEHQDTLTVALESTGIVPAPDAGITETEVIVASNEVECIVTNNQVDCTIDMLIAAASQQSDKDVQIETISGRTMS